ncbi:MAG: hypothetical protein ABSE89_08080 [Sedimentisphaerales bacterium]
MAKALNSLLNDIIGLVPGKEFARKIKKSEGYISQMRAGTQIPTEETLAIITNEFGIIDRLPELILSAAWARLKSQTQFNDKDNKLEKSISEAMESLLQARSLYNKVSAKKFGRTLNDFPDAFYPLVVVSGDKREERGSNISIADIGAYTATPADTRWILNLGLCSDIVLHIDKNFLLFPDDELIKQFAETNLLVVGSPAANHLARLINKTAVFRFNYSKDAEQVIEDIIVKARTLTHTQLIAYQEKGRNELAKRMRTFFTGGIYDPTYPDEYVAAKYARLVMDTQFDFGVLTFAANPYYEMKCAREGRENDHKYISIMAAGIHHPATAHALRLLGQDYRKKDIFAKHPYGGVIRVELDLSIPFPMRTMNASCQWEDIADKERKVSDNQKQLLLKELKVIEGKVIKGELKNLALERGQALECYNLIEKL